MSNSRLISDDLPADRSHPLVGDDLPPPVEPPSAGFIIQLFVVPALIVLVIVSVWLSFSWLVRRTATRPEDLIQGLEQGPSVARWQRASELADMLRNQRFASFKRSSAAANQLAGVLEREIDRANSAGGMKDDEVRFRHYLCRALGEFEVRDGIDALLKAAETNRDPSEQTVRDGALQALAVRAYNLHRLDPPQELTHPQLEPTLFRLAGEEDPLIRAQTAYVLGQIGTPACIERLEVMVDDPHADTRYNAAVALAHHGNAKSVETLAEMLDLEELASVEEESNDLSRNFKRAVIVSNAILSAQTLAQQNPHADFSALVEALQRLADADAETLAAARIPSRVVSDARRTLEQLQANGVGNRAE